MRIPRLVMLVFAAVMIAGMILGVFFLGCHTPPPTIQPGSHWVIQPTVGAFEEIDLMRYNGFDADRAKRDDLFTTGKVVHVAGPVEVLELRTTELHYPDRTELDGHVLVEDSKHRLLWINIAALTSRGQRR